MKKRDSHIFAKAKDGWYIEPEWCSARLFDVEKFAPLIHDPACGGGNILRSAEAAGYRAVGSDVVKRRGLKNLDFVAMNFLAVVRDSTFDYINDRVSVVCNPPFDHVEVFCRKACEIADKVAMIMLTRRLNAAHWLHELPLKKVYLLTPRPSMPPGEWIKAGNKPGGGTQDFCWLVFESGYKRAPEIGWLHRDGNLGRWRGQSCKPSRDVNTSRRIFSNGKISKSISPRS